MSDSKLCTQEAEKCRQHAREALDPDEQKSWLDLADEWQALADKLASDDAS
jgi:hypothetical protein